MPSCMTFATAIRISCWSIGCELCPSRINVEVPQICSMRADCAKSSAIEDAVVQIRYEVAQKPPPLVLLSRTFPLLSAPRSELRPSLCVSPSLYGLEPD